MCTKIGRHPSPELDGLSGLRADACALLAAVAIAALYGLR